MDGDIVQQTKEALRYLLERVPQMLQGPVIGIICGSGLNGLSNVVLPHAQFQIPYSSIPHFPISTVPGHAGKLLFGMLESGGSSVVIMQGRVHYYEGHSIHAITFPIRLMKRLGVEVIIVTNAAGGLNHDYAVGDIVILNDHINLAGLAGLHPLRGPNDFGVRFPALSDAYDLELRRRAHHVWKHTKRDSEHTTRLHEGCYAFVGGPSYETRAECRMLQTLGADLVGMSTVPEIIVARASDMRVLALSLVTNKAVLDAAPRGDDLDIQGASHQELIERIAQGRASHQEVLETGQKAAEVVKQFVESLMRDILSSESAL